MPLIEKYFFAVRHFGYSGTSYGFDPCGRSCGMAMNALNQLDPFVEGLPGCANVPLMKNFAERERLKPIVKAARLLREEKMLECIMLKERMLELKEEGNTRKIRSTAAMYKEHFKALADATILAEFPTVDVKFFSKYFSVPKSPEFERAIFNGKLLSSFFEAPPPVNTLDAPRLIDLIVKWHHRTNGNWYSVSGDLRHWFHQMRLAHDLQKYFGLHLRGDADRSYVWTCLPMGWSWSPYIAQSMAYAFLTYREEKEKSPFSFDFSALSGDLLPFFVPVLRGKEEVGFITVYYDNYIMISEDEKAASWFEEHVKNNTRDKRCNVQIKAGSEQKTTPQGRSGTEPSEWLNHLGVVIRQSAPQGGIVEWQVDPTKIDMLPEHATHGTIRDTARVIGRCLHNYFISRKPIAASAAATRLISILSKCGKAANNAFKSGFWDTPWDDLREVAKRDDRSSEDETEEVPATANLDLFLSEEEESFLHAQYLCIKKKPWYSTNPAIDEEVEDYILATDACSSGWGFVLMNKRGELVAHAKDEEHGYARPFNGQMARLHIFYQELYASVQSIKIVTRRLRSIGKSRFRVHVMGDNTAAMGALRAGFSSTDLGNRYIRELYEHMSVQWEGTNIEPMSILRYHTIISEDNVADVPSRKFTSSPHTLADELPKKRKRRNQKKPDEEDFMCRLSFTMKRFEEFQHGAVLRKGVVWKNDAERISHLSDEAMPVDECHPELNSTLEFFGAK